MIAPGDVLRNRYRIERSIGRGGMGEVFSAVVLVPAPGKEGDVEATLLLPSVESFRVAIKVVSRAVVSDAALARLRREAEAAARIRSPFIPELLDVATTDDGELFLAMELLHGETLSARLKSRRCLTWEEAVLIGDDVLSGLIDAHAAGVVHRDLKPSNIFLCETVPPDGGERAKVLDLGVCKIDAPDSENLTGTGESVGTASYMAPEQIRGASQVTERADLYSFATVMFEVVSGELPHAGASQMAVLASKLERNARRLCDAVRVPVPPGLEPLLARLLSREASARYATAREVRDAWRALGPAVLAPRAGGAGPATEATPLATEAGVSTATLDAPPPRSSRVGLALAAFSVLVSLAVVTVMVATQARVAERAPRAGASHDPDVSAAVVERPAAPAVAAVEPGAAPAEWVEDDAGVGMVTDAVPPLHPKVAAPRPWRAPGRPTGRGVTTRPHIADKPRY